MGEHPRLGIYPSAAALAWDRWESTHVSLDPLWQPGLMFDDDRMAGET
ncbi:hypothetical protein [Arthrobacter sp. NPDC057013]